MGGLDDYLIAVAREMVERGVPVTHFLDRFQRSASQVGILARVTSIDASQFMRPKEIIKLNEGREPALDSALINQFARPELVWLSVTDRYTQVLNVADRRKLFRELLEYFYRWLPENSIRTIVFPNVPHAGWNNVLYFVAKYLGITTIILEATRIPDRVVLWEDYEHVDKVPSDFLDGVEVNVIRRQIDPGLLGEFATDSLGMELSDEINRDALQLSRPVGEIIALIQGLARELTRRDRPRDLVFDEPWGWWDAHWRRYHLRRCARRRRLVYENLANRSVPSNPYVLFFLNYQPEKTTTPMGGVFDDQLLAVRLLSKGLPDGWKVLVKEHPRQFGAHVDAAPYRSVEFYRELAKIPKVQLVPALSKTSTLLDRCIATATITGSIGWQGLLAGKPTINFGRSWYAACASCYMVSSIPEIQVALADMDRKDVATVELDVLKFLAYLQSEFIIGSNATRYARLSGRPFEELVDGLSEALAQRILQGSL